MPANPEDHQPDSYTMYRVSGRWSVLNRSSRSSRYDCSGCCSRSGRGRRLTGWMGGGRSQVSALARVGVLGTLAVMLLVTGCGPGRVSRWNLDSDVRRPEAGVVIFLVDGLPPRFVEQGCEEGWLPNIKARLYDGGAHVRQATTSVPAITYCAISTLMTGVGPGRHGIVGNRWYDPEAALFRDYATLAHYDVVDDDHDVPLLYERIQPMTSAVIQSVHRRGRTQFVRNWALSGTMWFFKDYTAVDKLTASSVWRVAARANATGEWPAVVTFYFPGLDSVGHAQGPSSEEFHRALVHADHQVGRVCDWLERQGLLETTTLVLVSDHGMVDVDAPDGHIDLMTLVNDAWGRRATNEPRQDGSEAARRAHFDKFDTVVANQDGRAASLHFRSAAGWGVRPGPEVVESILMAPAEEQRLWNIPGVDLVAYLASADEVVVRSGRGVSHIQRIVGRDGDSVEYAYHAGADDVLGYREDPALAAFVRGGPYTSRAWLEATAVQTWPDVVSHLWPLLHVPRAGQVVVFAAPGYSFQHESGGHGGLHRDERLMTFCVAGPGIPAGGVVEQARSVDLVPTVLELLDVPVCEEDELEGRSIVAEMSCIAERDHTDR